MEESIALLRLCGILPCLRAKTEAQLHAMGKELRGLGFPCAEVDLTWEPAEYDAGSSFFASEGLAVGAKAGTGEQAWRAVEAGARWVSLPMREAMHNQEKWDKVFSRVESPEDLQALQGASLGQQLPFPQEAVFCCHPPYGEPLRTAFPKARLLISGCQEAGECQKWLATPGILAVSRPLQGMEGQAATQAKELHRLWVQTLDFSLAHIGINPEAAEAAAETARAFAKLLGLAYLPGEASDYAGTIIEAMKEKGRGRHGHIGIGTGDLARGKFYAERAGFAFDPASRKDDPAGRPILYYLDGEIGGFAVHLLQK